MTKESCEQEMAAAMAVLDGASREVLIESLISASGTLYSLMNGEPSTGQEMELVAVQMAVEFVKDNQTAAVEAEALATVDPARATIN
ncbi:MAG: hypothetical protein PHI97_34430 [Desulfobulbus sp.]|nr:hypothetical protein [Desulfobulbus sp.]